MSTIARSQKRFSGTRLDRISVHIEVPPVECDRVALAIVNLVGAEQIRSAHSVEAIQIRPR